MKSNCHNLSFEYTETNNEANGITERLSKITQSFLRKKQKRMEMIKQLESMNRPKSTVRAFGELLKQNSKQISERINAYQHLYAKTKENFMNRYSPLRTRN